MKKTTYFLDMKFIVIIYLIVIIILSSITIYSMITLKPSANLDLSGKLNLTTNPEYGIIRFLQNNQNIMTLYPNGTIWIKEGSEKDIADQLVKIRTSYNDGLKEHCRAIYEPMIKSPKDCYAIIIDENFARYICKGNNEELYNLIKESLIK